MSKIKFVNKVTATYRVLEESASHFNSFAKAESFLLSGQEMRTYFVNKYDFKEEVIHQVNDYSNMDIFIIGFRHSEFEMCKKYWKKISAVYLKERFGSKYLIFLLATRKKILFLVLSYTYRLVLKLR